MDIRRRSAIAVVLGLTVALSVAACGSRPETRPPTETSPRAVESPEPTPTPTAADAGHAVVLLACSGTSARFLTIAANTKRAASADAPQEACRSSRAPALSPDAHRVAFTFTDAKDNSSHVGWYEDGQRVDITASLTGTGGALASVRQDRYPTFSPSGDFYFMDTRARKIVSVSTASHAVLKEVGSAIYGAFLVTADGTLSPVDNRDFPVASAIPGDPGSRFCPSWRNFVQFFPGDGTAVLADLTVVKDNRRNAGSGCNDTETIRRLVPATDFSLSSSTYDPTTGTVYFVGTRGAERYLFSVPLDGSSEVVRVMDLAPLVRQTESLRVVAFRA